MSGLAGGADCILIPEESKTIDEICDILKRRHARGKRFSIVVASEGFQLKGQDSLVTKDQQLDQFGHVLLGGIGERLAKLIEQQTGFETRSTVLGHIQRGGSPTPFDRILGTRYGIKAVDLIEEGKLGHMVCLKGNQITSIPLLEAMTKLKLVDQEWIRLAEVFYG